MKSNGFIISLLTLITIVACGTDKQHFKLEGQLLNLNQGEFVIYSPDGAMPGADTIKVQGGRFELLASCTHEGTALIIMPNGSEVAVFVKPGADISIMGDAQNLKMIEVKGTKENEIMAEFRKDAGNKPEAAHARCAADCIEKHPEATSVGIYLLRQYILKGDKPDYTTATKLVNAMLKKNKDDAALATLAANIRTMKNADNGCNVPAFNVLDISGNSVKNTDLSSGNAVIVFWASWDYESLQEIRSIHNIRTSKNAEDRLKVIAVSMDASKSQAKQTLANDTTSWTNICDEKMTDSPLVHLFAVAQPSTAILVKDGKITDRRLMGEALYTKIRSIIGD